ncbi:MAG: type I DNA topoisomerase [Fimbriimonadales bacterium]|nr:type I DNA topoisomerase [Fimbriimonadales bacterium]
MSKTLVIVESPAKAKTISRFLGPDYQVEASVGHIRDLPEKTAELPPAMKKLPWARLGVDVDNGFKPLYVVPKDKRDAVRRLKSAAEEAASLLLATDEDREGESISWHILEELGRPKDKPVRRIVFHEITPEAIQRALQNPRDIDENLVRAQEARRILDRLFGYGLSPVLWRKVKPRLSAGRVQSVALRLLVERERQRKRFVPAAFAAIEATIAAEQGSFRAKLARLGGRPLAESDDFDPDTGRLKSSKAVLLQVGEAEDLARELQETRPWVVASVAESPAKQTPAPPFMTSTLQQEASRKLRLSARDTMRIAQQLYEGVDLGGERVGLITYMRTDSLNLAERAVEQARSLIRELYGQDYVPAKPRRYKNKSESAQEAHEAIRPTDLSRLPSEVRPHLTDDQFRLYELIWKRTVACQMADARLMRAKIVVHAECSRGSAEFVATGQTIVFPGFLKAYVEGSDDPEAQLADRETILPRVEQGGRVEPSAVEARERTTRPPARYTEASLVKRLEEEGIGRPSTYASILGTIQERGYCYKRRDELIPTFLGFAVTELLERHFAELVDVHFTRRMEDELDEIAEGHRDWVAYLRDFYFGDDRQPGLRVLTEDEAKLLSIVYPEVEVGVDPDTGFRYVVKIGRFGPYLVGPDGKTAKVPEDLPPADFGVEQAKMLLLDGAKGLSKLAELEVEGVKATVRGGRFGPYVEFAASEGGEPKRVTLPPDLKPEEVDSEALALLRQMPRTLGLHPESGLPVEAMMGRYGSYVRCGSERRNLQSWRQAFEIDLQGALELLAQPKVRRGGSRATPKEAIQTLETPKGTLRVLAGRYGPYVTDGKVNATLPKDSDPKSITGEEALRLLEARREAGPRPKRRSVRRRRSSA